VSETQGRFVRPYAITGGRTSVDGPQLELESQIVATDRGRANQPRYRWEAARVIEACDSATAVIEISAKLEIPVGVTRVVVSDLIKQGAVELLIEDEAASYSELLEKVLDGIRNL
jgi:hypothetical protein